MTRDVVVVIGAGGMGQAIARRQGSGKTLVIADVDERLLTTAAGSLAEGGLDVRDHHVDVSSRSSVKGLAESAAALGPVGQVVHTAGLSPVQATADAILEVDLMGVALVLEEFGAVVVSGGSGVVISSMAGHLGVALGPDDEAALSMTPAEELLQLPIVRSDTASDPGLAYALAKRANQLRVRAASVDWGERGARINSISPGIIATSMGRAELESTSGGFMRAMVAASAARRLGTPDDIAAVVAFLLGPESSFVSGTDVLVDGGAVAALQSGRVRPPG